ncbi:DUF5331 domain-containing protein [Aetokthonos hydrillicola Thurmond2011]|uniref:DUF5331 domain-containing protein n=1 Tax=Aetokthonos hydrillicola Thurmond2011 TaxID=2712845 RepID=A0AAP5IA03_9CYAN|nr:DUF5331 domain-containing protein [Aetokthonos hydrillicola]MBO3461171.1 DUF5331 domain-containing protein [Aetokthonos hydrillicola CCALA 1050]MBW4588617.1 DUF5331 domain-containing protein [Aetokthonos hydrillicola CCALA 1050]MDR9896292.1 DUF5331 domain-containing protein [Aetokthonos hydrillicola Thurmond2011]
MAFFQSFTNSLRQKWLQFFQINRDWIKVHMQVESVYTPDGGKRPSSYLILGVVNALEPKLAQLMLPFSKLNPDADTLIEVLELHFDPDLALGNRFLPKTNVDEYGQQSAVVIDEKPQDETLTVSHINGYNNESIPPNSLVDEIGAMSFEGETQVTGLQQTQNNENLNAVDEFGDISFVNEFQEVDDKVSTQTASNHNGFNDPLDVWGKEALPHNGKTEGEEELPSGAFDDSEIARLFPNT